jgi:chemotaxis protein methyltransferase CheR
MNRMAFDFLADLLRRESGMNITPEKSYLLESRLLPLAQQQGLAGVEALAGHLRRSVDNKAIRQAVVEAMMTHESSFFRDITPFQRLRETIIPALLEKRQATKTLRIWSAACAGGQEIYSIAMLLREMGAALSGWQIDLLATDVSYDVLEVAKSGTYSQFEAQRGLSVHLLVKYFSQDEEKWTIAQDLRDSITFRQANLMVLPPGLGQFDVIFCRNMLMYLDTSARARVLQNLHGAMQADSVLFLGAAENVSGLTQLFKPFPDMQGLFLQAEGDF